MEKTIKEFLNQLIHLYGHILVLSEKTLKNLFRDTLNSEGLVYDFDVNIEIL